MTEWKRRVVGVVMLVAALGASLWWLRRAEPSKPAGAVLSAVSVLSAHGDTTGYARAIAFREFRFPADHGPHREFQTEWWYWTGVLDGPAGRRFGYQLTFFRSALSPEKAPRPSQWGTTDVYMAHFTLTDEKGGQFRAFENLAREAVGLAGATAAPFHVWVLDWEVQGPDSTETATPMHLRASQDGVAIDLDLEQGKPPVLQGDRGLSQKGPEPGNASYYYSLTRMPTSGSVVAGGIRYDVRGESWMDREFSTSALSPDQAGWDWLSLALSDGRELMFYRLRKKDGSTDAMSGGSLVDAEGRSRYLGAGDATIMPLSTWQSPRSGAVYPSSFRLIVPSAGIDLDVAPLLRDQELDVSFRYWEGAVAAQGREGSSVSSARGYVELTGYEEDSKKKSRP
jgi:predicted secreted hydrolase